MSDRTELAPAYGMREVGGFGIRGWRVHCDCGYLSDVYENHFGCDEAVKAHRARHALDSARGEGLSSRTVTGDEHGCEFPYSRSARSAGSEAARHTSPSARETGSR